MTRDQLLTRLRIAEAAGVIENTHLWLTTETIDAQLILVANTLLEENNVLTPPAI